MGNLKVRGKFEPTKIQADILAKNKIDYKHEFFPKQEEHNGKLTHAYWETSFSWEGKEKPLTKDILCYEDDQDAICLLPKELADHRKSSGYINHTTTGLGGEKD